jgi:hypothetical protein
LSKISYVVTESCWYDGRREVHKQNFEDDRTIEYVVMGNHPDAAEYRWLREALENRVPVIYILAIALSRYIAVFPAPIIHWVRTNAAMQLVSESLISAAASSLTGFLLLPQQPSAALGNGPRQGLWYCHAKS